MPLKIAPILLCFVLAPVCAARAAQPVDFNRDIRPILSANCFKCHGIDEGARKSKLRLDVRDPALAPAKSGKRAIVPGHPEQSELIRRVFASNPDDVMPPSSTKVTLSDAQKLLLKRWVAEGAGYKVHWAFVAPQQEPPPEVKQADWCRNPIDRFVLARLEAEGLHPSPEADRYTLIRRVYLDLIGLPPTPAEADAFAHDPSPDAYEQLVDGLLANPHYGERWARRWLDLARYADTNGFEKDRPRSIWPYRDWVINAFNADMPFDQFTIKQLAGDMLPNATADDRIATGFHRNTMLNEEGGIDPLEYRFRAAVDRDNTTGTTWLGLTVRCAQCHTHKFDPITHTEYYRLMAFLNNADEPEMDVPSPKIDAERTAIEAKIAALTAELPSKFKLDGVTWETPPAMVVAAVSRVKPDGDGSWRFTGPAPDRDTYTFTFDSPAEGVDRIRLETLKDGKVGPGRTAHGNFVLTDFEATVAPIDAPEQKRAVKFVRAEADGEQNEFPAAAAIDHSRGLGWAVDNGVRPIPPHTATFFFDQPIHADHPLRWTITLKQQYGQRHTIARARLSLGSPEKNESSEPRKACDSAFQKWVDRESAHAVKWTVLRPDQMHSTTPFLTLKDDGSVLAGSDISKSDTYDLSFRNVPAGITAVRLEALPDESLPSHGPGMVYYEGTAGDFFLSTITLAADGKPARFAKAAQTFAAGNFVAANAIDADPQTGWSVAGAQGKPSLAVFGLSEPLGDAKELALKLHFERYFAAPLGHFRIAVTTDPRALDPHASPAEVEAALATPAAQRSVAQRDVLFQHFLEIAPELAEARNAIDQLRASMPKPPTTLVLRERPAGHDRPTFVRHRGEFLQPEEQVSPGVPAFLPPMPAGAAANRLNFARWLVEPQNPLTARVTVNRQWQAFFGRGLVRTLQDLGYQGDLPTHPELLDWLAIEFQREGWSLKKLDRLILTSATYRQSSLITPELLERDPQDVLLSRAPRFRLDAELIRDSALAAAGLLSEKIGGPSVFPPQPASVTTEGTYGALAWNASSGEERYRRSLYTFSKRTAPFAMYNTFDGPTGEECVAQRDVSDTPLQALTLLNDQMFIEAAQATGRMLSSEKGSDEAKITILWRRCLTRPPERAEIEMILAFVHRERQRLHEDPADAAALSGDRTQEASERAVWTTVARTVFNLDEMITRQ